MADNNSRDLPQLKNSMLAPERVAKELPVRRLRAENQLMKAVIPFLLREFDVGERQLHRDLEATLRSFPAKRRAVTAGDADCCNR